MMRTSDFRCVFLGRPADHLHHLTGRDPDGHYLDPPLWTPLVRRIHVVEHQGWRAAGIADGAVGDPNVLRLRRVGTCSFVWAIITALASPSSRR